MVAGDQPPTTVPSVGVRVPRLDHGAGPGEGEGVQTSVHRRGATDFYRPGVDATKRLVLKKVHEVVLLLRRVEPRCVGYGGKQNGSVGVVCNHLARVTGLQ